MKYTIQQNDLEKNVKSDEYNYHFDKRTGFFARWGKTKEDDPIFSPIGPEIADIEISTRCDAGCTYCYKDNISDGEDMPFEKYKEIFGKFSPSLTQIALGIGSDINQNVYNIIKYTKEQGIIPNITVKGGCIPFGIDNNWSEYIGAVAVSYGSKNETYETINNFTNVFEKFHNLTTEPEKQCNMHYMIAEETYDELWGVLKDIKIDKKLQKLNAIVFLSLKKKGRAENNFTQLSQKRFKLVVDYCLENNINFGFDSCSATKFASSIKGHKKEKELMEMCEPCESLLFSVYCDVNGKVFPCSFCENCNDDWKEGIDISEVVSFNDIWYNDSVMNWRKELLKRNRECIIYEI